MNVERIKKVLSGGNDVQINKAVNIFNNRPYIYNNFSDEKSAKLLFRVIKNSNNKYGIKMYTDYDFWFTNVFRTAFDKILNYIAFSTK